MSLCLSKSNGDIQKHKYTVVFEFTLDISNVSKELLAKAGNNYNVMRVYRFYMGDLSDFNCSHPQYHKLPDEAKLAANVVVVNVCEYNDSYGRVDDLAVGLICNDVMEILYRPSSSDFYSSEMNLNKTNPFIHYNDTHVGVICQFEHNSLNCKHRCFEEEPPMVGIPSWRLKKSNQFYRENPNCLTCITQSEYDKNYSTDKKQLELAVVILLLTAAVYSLVFLINKCGWIVGCDGFRLTNKADRYAILSLSQAFRQFWNGRLYCAGSNDTSPNQVNKCICNMELTFYAIDWMTTITLLLGSYVGPRHVLTLVILCPLLALGRRQLIDWLALERQMSAKRCVFSDDNIFLVVLAVLFGAIIVGCKWTKIRNDWRSLSKRQVFRLCLARLAELVWLPLWLLTYGSGSSRIRGPVEPNIINYFLLSLFMVRSLRFK